MTDKPQALTYEFNTSAGADALFDAISTPQGVRGWWCQDCDISSEVGGQHKLRFDKQGTLVKMGFEVTELAAGRRVAWRCTSNDNPVWVGSTLVWDMESRAGQGAKLTLTHDGFAAGGPPYDMTAQGWPRFVDSLKAVAEGRAGDPM